MIYAFICAVKLFGCLSNADRSSPLSLPFSCSISEGATQPHPLEKRHLRKRLCRSEPPRDPQSLKTAKMGAFPALLEQESGWAPSRRLPLLGALERARLARSFLTSEIPGSLRICPPPSSSETSSALTALILNYIYSIRVYKQDSFGGRLLGETRLSAPKEHQRGYLSDLIWKSNILELWQVREDTSATRKGPR